MQSSGRALTQRIRDLNSMSHTVKERKLECHKRNNLVFGKGSNVILLKGEKNKTKQNKIQLFQQMVAKSCLSRWRLSIKT